MVYIVLFYKRRGWPILTITAINEMHDEGSRLLRSGKAVALVPTMGFFHEGHLELMRQGRNYGDVLIVSIFVNPTQFGPSEDFEAYPRDFDRDLKLAESAGVDIVFAPKAEAMYDPGYQTYVDLDRLPKHLCGLSRLGHFSGVATVITKLFNLVRPHTAIFGEKDYQQLVIIRRMVQDLNFGIRIVGVPTVRERDGLAMSSRNAYLSEDERGSALSLFKALQQARQNVARGIRDAKQLIQDVSRFVDSYPYTEIEYVSVCDPETLDDVEAVTGPTLLALAVRVGKTRLIDNAIIKP